MGVTSRKLLGKFFCSRFPPWTSPILIGLIMKIIFSLLIYTFTFRITKKIDFFFTFLLMFFSLLFCFLLNWENIHIIHLNYNLFFDMYNIINEYIYIQVLFIGFSHRIWCLEKSDWKSYFITSFALSLIMISVLSFFECITCSSSMLFINCYC